MHTNHKENEIPILDFDALTSPHSNTIIANGISIVAYGFSLNYIGCYLYNAFLGFTTMTHLYGEILCYLNNYSIISMYLLYMCFIVYKTFPTSKYFPI